MEPGELKVRKPNYLKGRKTRVNKSRLVLVWNFFCLESGTRPLKTKHREKKTKVTPGNSRQKIENCSNSPDDTVQVQSKSFFPYQLFISIG